VHRIALLKTADGVGLTEVLDSARALSIYMENSSCDIHGRDEVLTGGQCMPNFIVR
jgi:hypothetical protein